MEKKEIRTEREDTIKRITIGGIENIIKMKRNNPNL